MSKLFRRRNVYTIENHEAPMSVAAAESPTRICTGCYRELPVSRFRFMRKEIGQRHPKCNECANRDERERRRRRRNKTVHDFTKLLIDQSSSQARATVVERMIRIFGGVDSLVAAWRDAIAAAKEDGRNCAVLRSFRIVMQLMLDAAETEQRQLSQVSDEELADAMGKKIIDWIASNPEATANLLRECGWQFLSPITEKDTEP